MLSYSESDYSENDYTESPTIDTKASYCSECFGFLTRVSNIFRAPASVSERLSRAAMDGNVPLMDHLIRDHDANVDTQDIHGTPLQNWRILRCV